MTDPASTASPFCDAIIFELLGASTHSFAYPHLTPAVRAIFPPASQPYCLRTPVPPKTLNSIAIATPPNPYTKMSTPDTPFISNASRPPVLPLSHPMAKNENPSRANGQAKITIPAGPLSIFIPAALAAPGVLHYTLDAIRITDSIASLAHPDEPTIFEQQIKIEGRRIIKSTTSPSTLDKIASDLLSRIYSYGEVTPDNINTILTRHGFRTEFTSDTIGFVERLVALQLVIRRGMELRQANPEGQLPMIMWPNPQSYNETDWDIHLSVCGEPGLSTPQPRSAQSQIEALEAMEANQAAAPPAGADNSAMLAQLMAAIKKQSEEVNARIDSQSDRITTMQQQQQGRPTPQMQHQDQRRRLDSGGSYSNPSASNVNASASGATFGPTPTQGNLYKSSPLSTHTTQITMPFDTGASFAPDYGAAMNQQPIDAADAPVTHQHPEIKAKIINGTRVRADQVFAYITNNDQSEILTPVTDAIGGVAFKTSTQSTRKMVSIGDLDTVTDAIIHVMAQVNEAMAHELRISFVPTMSKAHQFFGEDISLTTAYWDKHFNAFHLSIRAGVRIKLTFSREIANAIKDDITANRQSSKQGQQHRHELKQLNRTIRNMKQQSSATGPAGSTATGKTEDGPKGPRTVHNVSAAMRETECYNWKAGGECMVLDSNQNCVFKHVGQKGADPAASHKRWKERTGN